MARIQKFKRESVPNEEMIITEIVSEYLIEIEYSHLKKQLLYY